MTDGDKGGVQPTTNALVFVPGISRSWGDRSLRQLADDIVVAMDQLTSAYDFAATPGDPLAFGAGDTERSARRVTITRIERGDADRKAVRILDLFELDYARTLAADNERKALLWRAALVLLALVRGTRQFLGILSPRRHGKQRAQRLQLFFLLGVLGLYAVLLGVLCATIIQVALEALNQASTALSAGATLAPSVAPSAGASTGVPTSPAQPSSGGFGAVVRGVLTFMSLASVVIWLFLPPKAKVKETITNTGTDFLTMDYYLRAGANAPQLQGALTGLIDAVRDGRAGLDYRRIDLASYSLGSIVAFNSLFPYGSPPDTASPIAAVDTFVSIGCPFDTIRLIRPGYFTGRHGLPGAPRQWLNVYTPNDILGSNFRNDAADEQPDEKMIALVLAGAADKETGIPMPVNLPYYAGGVPQGPIGLDLALGGMRAHAIYWELARGGESTCFNIIVRRLYGDDGTLGPGAVTAPAPATPGGPTGGLAAPH